MKVSWDMQNVFTELEVGQLNDLFLLRLPLEEHRPPPVDVDYGIMSKTWLIDPGACIDEVFSQPLVDVWTAHIWNMGVAKHDVVRDDCILFSLVVSFIDNPIDFKVFWFLRRFLFDGIPEDARKHCKQLRN